jgi:hypothetical protein
MADEPLDEEPRECRYCGNLLGDADGNVPYTSVSLTADFISVGFDYEHYFEPAIPLDEDLLLDWCNARCLGGWVLREAAKGPTLRRFDELEAAESGGPPDG